LYDQQTQSHWLHLTGECIEGKHRGAQLRSIPCRHVFWREWLRDHPETEAMADEERYRQRYYSAEAVRRGVSHFPSRFLGTIQTRSKRLSLSDLCYGVKTQAAARAYPFDVLASIDQGVVNDIVGDVPVVIVFDWKTRSTVGHGRRLEETVLRFERTDDGLLRDTTTGSVFNRDGFAVSGSLAGRRLPTIVGLQAEWYGWYATYPETTVFEIP